MPITWNWKNKMGQMTCQRTLNGGKKKTFKVNIYQGNCLAIFINEYKDADGKKFYNLYDFFMDKAHLKRIIESHGGRWNDEVVSMRLNLYYKECLAFLPILVKHVPKITVFYKEPHANR